MSMDWLARAIAKFEPVPAHYSRPISACNKLATGLRVSVDYKHRQTQAHIYTQTHTKFEINIFTAFKSKKSNFSSLLKQFKYDANNYINNKPQYIFSHILQ